MDNDKILLLSQLINGLQEINVEFEKSYKANDKKKFDKAKQAILEFQKKIAYLLQEK